MYFTVCKLFPVPATSDSWKEEGERYFAEEGYSYPTRTSYYGSPFYRKRAKDIDGGRISRSFEKRESDSGTSLGIAI